MTKKSFKTLLAAAVIATSANSSASTDNVPVILGSGCKNQLVTPDGSAGYISSGDCKTIFVLPNISGKVQTVSFQPTAHMLSCQGVEDYVSAKADSLALIRKLRKKLGTTTSESGRKNIAKTIADLEVQANAGSEFLRNKPGAVAQLLFTHGVEQADINNWFISNMELVRSQGINFKAAPILTSVLSFSMPKVDEIEEDFILSSTIPNLVKKQDNNVRTVSFNGSLNGQVVFSLFGACPLIDRVPKNFAELNKAKLRDENLGAFLVANRNYEVSTRSQMKYVATLKKDEFIHYFNEFAKTRTVDFKIHEFVERDGVGTVEDFVHFDISVDQMTSAQVDNWVEFKSMVMNEVATRLSTRMLKTLESIGYLGLSPEVLDEAPAPGVVYVDGTQTSCSSKRVFGIKIGGGCRTYAVKIPRNVDGKATLIDSQSVDSLVTIKESMTIEQPFSYLYTAGFLPATR